MNSKIFATAVVMIMMTAAVVVVFNDDGTEAVTSFTIKDGTDRTFNYTGTTKHIVTMGYAATLTVAELGEINKIIAVDKYSTFSYTNDVRLKDMKAQDMGTIYNASNNDFIVSTFVQWVEEKKMLLDDTIILTAYSNAKVLRESLEAKGFTHVLIYLSVTQYDQIIDFVTSISKIVKGSVTDVVTDMQLVLDKINEGLKSVEKKSKGLYVHYSSSAGFSVGNKGSIAVSLIESAGGINIGYTPDSTKSTYGDKSTVVTLVNDNRDVVIFLSAVYLNDNTVDDFYKDVLGGDKTIKVVPMKSVWNNYCPDSSIGLWTFASAMYPALFNGDVPSGDKGVANDNTMMYVIAAAVAVIVIIGITFYILRK